MRRVQPAAGICCRPVRPAEGTAPGIPASIRQPGPRAAPALPLLSEDMTISRHCWRRPDASGGRTHRRPIAQHCCAANESNSPFRTPARTPPEFFSRKSQYQPGGVLAVAHADVPLRQVSHFDAVSVRVAQGALGPGRGNGRGSCVSWGQRRSLMLTPRARWASSVTGEVPSPGAGTETASQQRVVTVSRASDSRRSEVSGPLRRRRRERLRAAY